MFSRLMLGNPLRWASINDFGHEPELGDMTRHGIIDDGIIDYTWAHVIKHATFREHSSPCLSLMSSMLHLITPAAAPPNIDLSEVIIR